MHLRALIIDDSSDDALVIARILRRSGILADWLRVDTAEAISGALADDRGWDVVLCDHLMPRLDAARVLYYVHLALPSVPVILVCGRYPSELWHELGSGLVRRFVSKEHLADLPGIIISTLHGARRRAPRNATRGFPLPPGAGQSEESQ